MTRVKSNRSLTTPSLIDHLNEHNLMNSSNYLQRFNVVVVSRLAPHHLLKTYEEEHYTNEVQIHYGF